MAGVDLDPSLKALAVFQTELARAASCVEASRVTISRSRELARSADLALTTSRDKVARCLALMERCRIPA